MNMSNVLNELFTTFKIEKWNNDKCCWEHFRGYVSHNSARCHYMYLLKNSKGIYRLIKVIELEMLEILI